MSMAMADPLGLNRLHAEGVSACDRTMAQLERDGSFYVNGVYHPGSATYDRAAQLHAESVARRVEWDARRDAWLDRVASEIGLGETDDADALERQRAADGADVPEDAAEDKTAPGYIETEWEIEFWNHRAFPVACGWCQAMIALGNPALPTSHGICDPCAEKLQRSGAA